MREKLSACVPIMVKPRITPACAGKTSAEDTGKDADGDHPRVCGKNRLSAFNTRLLTGSPPRVREKPGSLQQRIDEIGITPACAGKTGSSVISTGLVGDHPRVCGKNSPKIPPTIDVLGSPPRVREKHWLVF